MAQPPPLSAKDAKAKILIILAKGDVIPTDHCQDEMFEANADMTDVLNVLETGRVSKHEWNEEHQNWKYRVDGEYVDGEELTAITVIVESDMQLIVVTVF
jgi:hypothetical protein